jgi:hypothetical protein
LRGDRRRQAGAVDPLRGAFDRQLQHAEHGHGIVHGIDLFQHRRRDLRQFGRNGIDRVNLPLRKQRRVVGDISARLRIPDFRRRADQPLRDGTGEDHFVGARAQRLERRIAGDARLARGLDQQAPVDHAGKHASGGCGVKRAGVKAFGARLGLQICLGHHAAIDAGKRRWQGLFEDIDGNRGGCDRQHGKVPPLHVPQPGHPFQQPQIGGQGPLVDEAVTAFFPRLFEHPHGFSLAQPCG